MPDRDPERNPERDREYAERGVVTLPPPLPADTLQALCGALEAWSADTAATASSYGILRHNLWREVPLFREVLEGPSGRGLARLAADLLAVSAVTLFQDNLIWKPPGTSAGVQWHQDYAYWPLSAPCGVTFWLALDDADEANGCLRYIPGTHREGERQPTNFTAPGAAPWRQDLPPLDTARRTSESRPLLAGGLLAHHPLTWHMSGGNPSLRHRRAWSLTWVTDAARWAPDHAPHPYNHWLAPTPGAPVAGESFLRFCFSRGEGRQI